MAILNKGERQYTEEEAEKIRDFFQVLIQVQVEHYFEYQREQKRAEWLKKHKKNLESR